VPLAGRGVEIGRGFLEDLDRHDPERVVSGLNRALLIFHSPTDTVVGVDNAGRLYGWAKHPKSFISLGRLGAPDADHLLSDPEDAAYVAESLATWARRSLG